MLIEANVDKINLLNLIFCCVLALETVINKRESRRGTKTREVGFVLFWAPCQRQEN